MAHHQEDITLGEKAGAIEVEKVAALDARNNNASEASVDLDESQLKVLKKATRKTDYRLVPILGACYAISAIDRINISAARIAGMDKELHFEKGSRYSIALLVFFITYFIFEIPSNVVLRKVGAANWLSFLCFAWGVVILGAGFAKKWTDIVVCRLLLGLFEAGFFPGSVYLISCWYTRYEVQKRLATFYAINIFANGFGSILAYGIMQLNGKAGYLGWRWIFIINGLMTVFLALLGRLLIVDFPDKVHRSRKPFLKPDEVRAIQDKLERDRSDSEFDELTMKKFLGACARWELWFFGLQFFAVTTIVYALAFFIPIILQGMSYDVKMVFLLCAPPAVAAVPWVIFCSWAADKTRLRGPWIILQAVIGIIGLMIVAYAKNNGARYFGIFVGLAGANSNIPTALAWQANNIRGQSLRMVASGLQVAFGAIGGIYASTVFMEKEAPTYISGLWAVTGAQLYIIVSSLGILWFYKRQNKRADQGEIIIEGLEGFRYTY
ncbi:MFS general substrate transporter [Aaosphaeria arxii CBS 175.79]|uniref:MFS general substrate transporter n=1 Tax=Aaosphaeria arxii CBS 175.79 TaxID=1450172 RepID=A0A6A5XA83_9PLEO|nr:MFS general substrate transporter [Aaosphaeria arxii CBS 175.79]KAF2009766.1 MFS general substrate transporter [Aaosphaeria arxii CBS 175.79]